MSCAKTAKFLSRKVCTQLNHRLDFSCAHQGQEKRYVDPVSVGHRVLPILTVKVLVAHGYLQEHEINLTKWTPHLETKFHILLLRISGDVEKQRVCQDIFSNTTLQLTNLQNGIVYFRHGAETICVDMPEDAEGRPQVLPDCAQVGTWPRFEFCRIQKINFLMSGRSVDK